MLPVSDRARQALLLAHDEARALRHSYIGTEHILLGLLRERDGFAAGVLTSLGVEYEPVRAAVVRMLGLGVEDPGDDLPSTGAATNAVERAGREAAVLGAEQDSAPSTSCSRSCTIPAVPRRGSCGNSKSTRWRSGRRSATPGPRFAALAAQPEVGKDRAEVEPLAGQLAEELLGVEALAVAPQPSQHLPGLG